MTTSPGLFANSSTDEASALRADALFLAHRQQIFTRTDRMFAGLMGFQWLMGILFALFLSPLAWAGRDSHVHPHVWSALFLGAAIASIPIFMALRWPGRVLTRHVIAVGQMLTSALLIHLTGGRIETHFHVFGSLAFLAFYKDARVLGTATVVTALVHLLGGMFSPQSVYGVLAASPWRWLEHAAWVLFEDAFLIVSIRRSLHEKFHIAERQVQLEVINANLDQRVSARTQELDAARLAALGMMQDAIAAKATVDVANAELEQQITQRRHAEAALRLSEEYNRSIVESGQDCLKVLSLDGRLLEMAAPGRKLMCVTDFEQIRNADWFSFWKGEDHEAARRAVAAARAGEIGWFQGFAPTMDGTPKWWDVIITPIRDTDGKVNRLLGVSRDITEQKAMIDALHQSELRFRSLVTATAQIVWHTSAEGMVSNPMSSWRAYTGQTEEEVQGAGWCDALHPDDMARAMEVWRQAVEARSLYELDYRIRRRDGVYREFTVRGAPVLNEDGSVREWVGTCTDITERLKNERLALRSQRMESIGTLAGGIAHDLNNVLAPILMSIELLRMQERDQRRMSILTTVEGSAKRGADMVRQLLSFARGVEGQQTAVQVGHLLHEIEKIANDTFLKTIDVHSDIPADLWLVQGDPTQIHQVLLNLCVNARDAMPNHGTLSLSASNLMLDAHYAAMNCDTKPGPYVVIQVEDTGSGMPPEVIDRIFEPFYTTKELGKGTGLGLSTTLSIIQSHGGFVQVYSEVGMGTKFRVHLPAQMVPGSACTTRVAAELPCGNGELVLVVDDEAVVAQITLQTLETFGYRVLLAADGAAATSCYAAHQQDIAVVLTDMMMPTMDGPTSIQMLMQLNPQVKIIAVSGLSANGMVAKATSAGVKHFIPKPYTAETLLKTLRQVLHEPT